MLAISNIVMNKLLVMLQNIDCGSIAYADAMVITKLNRFADTVRNKMQLAMKKIAKQASSRDLGINPGKTEVVVFTRKYKPPLIHALSMHKMELVLKNDSNSVGLILDRKLNWKSNINDRLMVSAPAIKF